jgi:alpha-galactosidase
LLDGKRNRIFTSPPTLPYQSDEQKIDACKYDNCGEYGLGNARFNLFADVANATGRPMVISTEPFSLLPTPSVAEFANAWRTTNDINAGFSTILDRIDTNDPWAPLAGPGGWNE